jgi:hypothetical protein
MVGLVAIINTDFPLYHTKKKKYKYGTLKHNKNQVHYIYTDLYSKMSRQFEDLEGMSHTHGAHMGDGPVYYSGDNRSMTGPVLHRPFPPPAWLVADWMLDKHKGRPISERASKIIMAPTTNGGLLWLRDFLQQS